jgi:hypothetical protein
VAIAYGDVFDYPLTVPEVHRYLSGVEARPDQVATLVASGYLAARGLVRRDGHVMLAGREGISDTRRRRHEVATRLWPDARRYARVIARLPFVRMIAVTGALAIDNVEPDADIDYLVVTSPGRLWLCRALVVAVVRWAGRRGVRLCPNYFLSEDALVLSDRSLFTAHELAQMVPLAGASMYLRMRALNAWTARWLPNAGGPPRQVEIVGPWNSMATRLAERGLQSPIGACVERWEMGRKVRRFRARADAHPEAAFGADRCKGHFDGHGRRTLAALTVRLRALGLPARVDLLLEAPAAVRDYGDAGPVSPRGAQLDSLDCIAERP